MERRERTKMMIKVNAINTSESAWRVGVIKAAGREIETLRFEESTESDCNRFRREQSTCGSANDDEFKAMSEISIHHITTARRL